ncbi:MAG TPA: hypothetical protein VH395_07275 [Jatrophihabitantaceae bacterium]
MRREPSAVADTDEVDLRRADSIARTVDGPTVAHTHHRVERGNDVNADFARRHDSSGAVDLDDRATVSSDDFGREPVIAAGATGNHNDHENGHGTGQRGDTVAASAVAADHVGAASRAGHLGGAHRVPRPGGGIQRIERTTCVGVVAHRHRRTRAGARRCLPAAEQAAAPCLDAQLRRPARGR